MKYQGRLSELVPECRREGGFHGAVIQIFQISFTSRLLFLQLLQRQKHSTFITCTYSCESVYLYTCTYSYNAKKTSCRAHR